MEEQIFFESFARDEHSHPGEVGGERCRNQLMLRRCQDGH
jgi:hypothetical protein